MTILNKMSRSSHGLTSRRNDWREHATCATPDVHPDMWDTAADYGVSEAAHICLRHCPVRQQCLRDTIDTPADRRRSVVLAGIAFDQHGQPIATQDPATRCRLCPGVRGEDLDQHRERRREQWRRSSARRRAEAAA